MKSDHRTPGELRLRELPSTFSYSQALRLGLSDRSLYRLRDLGLIEVLGRGLYRRNDDAAEAGTSEPIDVNLLEISYKAPHATLCLTTALAYHGLTDSIPMTLYVALPRGRRHPVTSAPVTWHSFNPKTFDIGREEIRLDADANIGLYGQQRCLIDAFRLAHQEGAEVAIDALKRWLRRPDGTPAELLEMARQFPTAMPGLRQALVTLL